MFYLCIKEDIFATLDNSILSGKYGFIASSKDIEEIKEKLFIKIVRSTKDKEKNDNKIFWEYDVYTNNDYDLDGEPIFKGFKYIKKYLDIDKVKKEINKYFIVESDIPYEKLSKIQEKSDLVKERLDLLFSLEDIMGLAKKDNPEEFEIFKREIEDNYITHIVSGYRSLFKGTDTHYSEI